MPDPLKQSISATESPGLFNRAIPEPNSGCYIWLGAVNTHGYGHLKFKGKYWQAHRLAYEQTKGPIAPGLVIDHLCRNRACINPDHLEPVTNAVNVLRGNNIAASRAAQTHCKRGHKFTAENTYRSGRSGRMCLTCQRLRHKGGARA